MLRLAIGLTAAGAGVFFFSAAANPALAEWSLGCVLIASGAALAIGFLTPYAALLAGLCFLGSAVGWFPAAAWAGHDSRGLAIAVIVTSAALALLGPGAFSLDGRLFGRREIVIPPSSRPPEA